LPGASTAATARRERARVRRGSPARAAADDPPEALAARGGGADDGGVRYELPQPYQELSHTADTGIAAEGATREEALARLVLALGALLAGGGSVTPDAEETVVAAGGADLAQTAVAALREVLFRFATRHVVPGACEVLRLSPGRAELRVAFGRFDPARHREGADVKAVTYHRARFEPVPGGWRAQVILDV